MTLEEINDIEDKDARLRSLNAYFVRAMQAQRDEDEIEADEDRNATRDEAHGMMSRYGKPTDGNP